MPLEGQNKLLLYIIILSGFIAGFIFYTQAGVTVPDIPVYSVSEDDLGKLKDLEIDFTSFSSSHINNLKLFGEYPLVPGELGKTDVFSQ